RLARTALYEGDAMAVMTAFSALLAHKPIKASIASGAATLKALDAQALLKMSGKSPQLQHAPPVLREELVLPYAAGFALVADAYTIVEGPKNALSLLWTTAWSSGVAGNVSNVMKLVQPCWQEQAAGGPNPLGWSMAAPSRIASSAQLVAVARGSVELVAATA